MFNPPMANFDFTALEQKLLAGLSLDKESIDKADYVSQVHGLTWPSNSSAVSFYDLVKQGVSAEQAEFAVELATGEKASKSRYSDSRQDFSYGYGRKEPKKKLPYYQGKRRF